MLSEWMPVEQKMTMPIGRRCRLTMQAVGSRRGTDTIAATLQN